MTQRPGGPQPADVWVGRRLERVATAWFEYSDERNPEPQHLWVQFSGLHWQQLRGAGSGQDVLVLDSDPYESYEMPEYESRVVVKAGGPESLASAVGLHLRSWQRLRMRPPDMTVGMLLHFEDLAVGVINPADTLFAATWPDAEWVTWGIEIEV